MLFGDEHQLLARTKQGDADALGELYDRYSAKIYAYVFFHVGNQELAEDLTAGVFIKMLDAVRSSKAWQSSFSGWLYRIAHNMIVDHFRRDGQRQHLPLDEHLVAAKEDPVSAVEEVLTGEMLGEALLCLTEEQRSVIVYKFCEGLSNLQIARLMGKTEGAIKSLQYRALASLRRYLDGYAGERDGQAP
jgi:RNA polymerase sigma-70 factor (ECF subfamily)